MYTINIVNYLTFYVIIDQIILRQLFSNYLICYLCLAFLEMEWKDEDVMEKVSTGVN